MRERAVDRGGGGGGSRHAIGTVLGQRWRLRRRVGKGTFSEIFEAADLRKSRGPDGRHPQVAVKIARDSHKCSMLAHEHEVLQGLQDCPNVARCIEMGKDSGCSFLIMTLLGENLSELRRLTPPKRFSMQTTMLLGLQLLECIRCMHELGYVHRDIKPSNCCIGLAEPTKCYLCDFGLARRWRLPNGEPRPRREHVEFRGTCRYASVHSHQQEELGRRDDLWSLFYMLLELHCGVLPWHSTRDHDKVLELKRELDATMNDSDPNHPCFSPDGIQIPHGFVELLRHLKSLSFEESPNYHQFSSILSKMLASSPPAPGATPGAFNPMELNWCDEGVPLEKRIVSRHNKLSASANHISPSFAKIASPVPANLEVPVPVPPKLAPMESIVLPCKQLVVSGQHVKHGGEWLKRTIEGWVSVTVRQVTFLSELSALIELDDLHSAALAIENINGWEGLTLSYYAEPPAVPAKRTSVGGRPSIAAPSQQVSNPHTPRFDCSCSASTQPGVNAHTLATGGRDGLRRIAGERPVFAGATVLPQPVRPIENLDRVQGVRQQPREYLNAMQRVSEIKDRLEAKWQSDKSFTVRRDAIANEEVAIRLSSAEQSPRSALTHAPHHHEVSREPQPRPPQACEAASVPTRLPNARAAVDLGTACSSGLCDPLPVFTPAPANHNPNDSLLPSSPPPPLPPDSPPPPPDSPPPSSDSEDKAPPPSGMRSSPVASIASPISCSPARTTSPGSETALALEAEEKESESAADPITPGNSPSPPENREVPALGQLEGRERTADLTAPLASVDVKGDSSSACVEASCSVEVSGDAKCGAACTVVDFGPSDDQLPCEDEPLLEEIILTAVAVHDDVVTTREPGTSGAPSDSMADEMHQPESRASARYLGRRARRGPALPRGMRELGMLAGNDMTDADFFTSVSLTTRRGGGPAPTTTAKSNSTRTTTTATNSTTNTISTTTITPTTAATTSITATTSFTQTTSTAAAAATTIASAAATTSSFDVAASNDVACAPAALSSGVDKQALAGLSDARSRADKTLLRGIRELGRLAPDDISDADYAKSISSPAPRRSSKLKAASAPVSEGCAFSTKTVAAPTDSRASKSLGTRVRARENLARDNDNLHQPPKLSPRECEDQCPLITSTPAAIGELGTTEVANASHGSTRGSTQKTFTAPVSADCESSALPAAKSWAAPSESSTSKPSKCLRELGGLAFEDDKFMQNFSSGSRRSSAQKAPLSDGCESSALPAAQTVAAPSESSASKPFSKGMRELESLARDENYVERVTSTSRRGQRSAPPPSNPPSKRQKSA